MLPLVHNEEGGESQLTSLFMHYILNTVISPTVTSAHEKSIELSCVVEHINTHDSLAIFETNEKLLDLGVTKAHRLPVGLYSK